MKPGLLEVPNHVCILVALISLLLNISVALPAPDGISGKEADIWHDSFVGQVYGPWSERRKINRLYADYNEYLTGVQDFAPGPEDDLAYEPEVAESGPADFPSNYGEAEGDESESDVPYQPQSTSDQDVGDQVASGDPENHELEGNVQWTSSAT